MLKKYLIYIISGVVYSVSLIFLTVGISGCISAPKYIKNEYALCYDVKYIAYVYHKSSNPPVEAISDGLKTCRNFHIITMCNIKTTELVGKLTKENDDFWFRTYNECFKSAKQQ